MRNQVTLPTGETRSVWMDSVEELEAFLLPFCDDGYFATIESLDGCLRITFDQRSRAPVDEIVLPD